MKELLKEINQEIKVLNDEIDKSSKMLEQYKMSAEFKKDRESSKQQKFDISIDEYQAKSFLMVPSILGDSGNRPLTSFVVGTSTGVKIYDPAGMEQAILMANRDYTIEAEVVNKGDLYAPIINVDFFCSPKYQESELRFEIKSLSFFFNAPILKGVLAKGTLSIGDHIKIVSDSHTIYTQLTGITMSSGTAHTVSSSGQEINLFLDIDRLKDEFKDIVKPGDLLVEALDYNSHQRMFRFRIEDVFTITGRGIVVTGLVEFGEYNLGDKLNLFTGSSTGERSRNRYGITPASLEVFRRSLTHIEARDKVGILFRGSARTTFKRGDILVKQTKEEFTASIAPAEPPITVNEMDYLGSRTTYCQGFDSARIKLNWRSPMKRDRKQYIFTARTYSTLPTDMPTNFDDLNPELDRHVGTKKVGWDG